MIVDTSALVAIVKNEPESLRCKASLYAAATIAMSAANLLEAFSVVDWMNNPVATETFQTLLTEAAIQIAPATEAQVHVAREAFACFGRGRHPAKLNFGDCFAYSLARMTGEPLLFVGNDFG